MKNFRVTGVSLLHLQTPLPLLRFLSPSLSGEVTYLGVCFMLRVNYRVNYEVMNVGLYMVSAFVGLLGVQIGVSEVKYKGVNILNTGESLNFKGVYTLTCVGSEREWAFGVSNFKGAMMTFRCMTKIGTKRNRVTGVPRGLGRLYAFCSTGKR